MDRRGSGGREKWVSGQSKGTARRGNGLGMGQVGRGSGGFSSGGSGGGTRGSGGGRGPSGFMILIAIVVMLMGGGSGMLSSVLFGSGEGGSSGQSYQSGNVSSGDSLGNYLGQSAAQTVNGWTDGTSNTGVLNTKVAAEAREKRTAIRGNGTDTVTVMVYMCGSDLESKSGMATSDLKEMASAELSDQVNLLVYTGGCKSWKNQIVNNKVNQIYQIKSGGMKCLESNMGNAAMTDPAALTKYIQWCAANYPADRYELIMWNHGGGSISGYGYDEKNPRAGSMSLPDINKALKNAGVSFDFIGFDACLMATMENALMLTQYGDYLIASEETEPGYGWYYTNWLTRLSQNTSMPTIEIGKIIADDFVRDNVNKGQGSNITLSVVDLAELEKTAPQALSDFSRTTGEMVRGDEYKTVSNARSNCREFAKSSKIDQVDLIHLAENVGTKEGAELSEILRSAVKYNSTAKGMTNAYGLSIYFPYKKTSKVDTVVSDYKQIGMDAEYTKCIQDFASLEVAGQVAAGGSSSPLPTLLGSSDYQSSESMGSDLLMQMLGSLISGSYSGISGLDASNSGFFQERVASEAASYVLENQFDESNLQWQDGADGVQRLCMSDEQWDLIQQLELNCFYDDGQGYIDLGLDNIYQFDDDGNLMGENDHTWLAVNGQPVAYYFMDEVRDGDDYTITGYVPAMLNGDRVNLILVFEDEQPHGYISGAQYDYDESETETVAKSLTELNPGDTLEFLCDYYSYDGTFQDSYYLGEPMQVEDSMVISNVDVGAGELRATYRLTDIYNNYYWTEPLK